jgi:flavin-dependent dehydrogenase
VRDELWDAVVIGAGVAGSIAAYQLARSGTRVLLIDRATFPRDKVCGCCLNAHALRALEECGLARAIAECGVSQLSRFDCCWARRRFNLNVTGAAISRRALDAALVEAAITAGVEFLPATTAAIGDCDTQFRHVQLSNSGQDFACRARVVIAADGLSGHSAIGANGVASSVDWRGRIGAHAILNSAGDDYPRGAITMVCGSGGYVGLVRLEDGRLNVAGAFDLSAVRRHGGPGQLAKAILQSAVMPAPAELTEATWHGTPRMTHRRRRVAAERLLIIGDSAGYVEPFTGEGMAWAAQSALLVTPLALEAIHSWSPLLATRWNQMYRRAFGSRQRLCYLTTRLLRHHAGRRLLFGVLGSSNWLARRLVHHIHGDASQQDFIHQLQSTY